MSTARASHVLDAALALDTTAPGRYQGQTHPAYANMVGPFGGTIGATLLNAILLHPERLGDPVSLTVHFAAPIADGGFDVHARPMRTNRSTQHWLAELEQGGAVAAYATAVTATRRDAWGAPDMVMPESPPAASVAIAPAVPQAAWTANYELRFIEGGMQPQAAAPDSSLTRVWMRDQPARALDYLSLAALCDAFFPRIFVRRPKWVAVGTVTLTTYFHADAAQLADVGEAPVLGVARASRFEQGFFDQSAQIWSGAGSLLAVSHQLVYYKE